MAQNSNNRNTHNRNVKKGSKGSNKKLVRNIVLVAEALILVAVIVVLIYTFRITDEEGGVTKYNINEEDIIDIKVDENDPLAQEIRNDYTTLAFFGVDARNGTLQKGTRTDTIIICSIDNATGDARLCSVYRDTYLNTDPDSESGSYQKCNAAYALGGPERALKMLNANLDLYITKFITVGFDGVMNTVDAVGGVDIDIQADEIKFLNDYQASMYSTETNTVITDDYVPVTEIGMQRLSGYQALAYCRIRYTAGNDFKRTERQRDVVSQIVAKAKKIDPKKVSKICEDVLPYVATNMDLDSDILPMAADVNKYTIVDSSGFPFSDKITTGLIGPKGDCVIPLDFEANVKELHEFLYPGMAYTPSQNVIDIGARIKSDTSPYVGQ